jgi:hypothetical protein
MIERTLSGYQLAFVRMALHKKVEIRKLEAARSAAFATRSIKTFPASTGVFHAGATSLLGTMIRRDAGRMSTVQVHGLDSPQGPYGALSYSRAIAIANDASCLVYFSGLMCMEPSRSDGATSIEKELDDVLRKFDATLSSICVDGRRFHGDLKSSAFCCSAFVAHEELVEATRRIVVDACPNAQCAVFVAGLARSSHVEVEMQAVLDGAPIG